MPHMPMREAFREYRGQYVVLDLRADVVYIGRLLDADDCFISLADADVHELRAGSISREVYVMEARRNGVRPNRKLVKVKQSEVLSLSRLDDIILY